MNNKSKLRVRRKWAVLTLPNILSFSRLFILAPIVLALLEDQGFWAAILMSVSYFTDVADGIIARAFKQESEFGRILDSSVDKLTLVLVLCSLAAVGSFPLWALILMVSREVVIVGTNFYLITKRLRVVPPLIYGKITGVVFLVMEISYAIDFYPLNFISLCVAVVMMTVALAMYIEKFKKKLSGAKLFGPSR